MFTHTVHQKIASALCQVNSKSVTILRAKKLLIYFSQNKELLASTFWDSLPHKHYNTFRLITPSVLAPIRDSESWRILLRNLSQETFHPKYSFEWEANMKSGLLGFLNGIANATVLCRQSTAQKSRNITSRNHAIKQRKKGFLQRSAGTTIQNITCFAGGSCAILKMVFNSSFNIQVPQEPRLLLLCRPG